MSERNSTLRRVFTGLLVAGIAMIVVGILINVFDRADAQAFEQRLTTLEQQTNTIASKLPQARTSYEVNHLMYPDRYSSGLDTDLNTAAKQFSKAAEGGGVQSLLKLARQFQTSDRGKAKGYAEQVETIMRNTTVLDRILGDGKSPPLYDDLLKKTNAADSRVSDADKAVTKVRTDLDSKKKEVWPVSHGLTFPTAEAKYTEAVKRLGLAQAVLTTKIERGLVDKPLAYDEAGKVSALVGQVLEAADAEIQAAQAADSAITNAQRQIDSDQSYIWGSYYHQVEAQLALNGANATLNLARQSFAKQDFADAQNKAVQAQQQSQNSYAIASTPTPIPPTPTPRPTATPRPPDPIVFEPSSPSTSILDDSDSGGSIFGDDDGGSGVFDDSDFGDDNGAFVDDDFGDDNGAFGDDF